MPKSVVIVGGGAGGLFTANKLTSKLASEVRRGEVSITLVEPREKQVYQPGFLYIPFLELPPDVMFRPVSKLVSPLVKVERESRRSRSTCQIRRWSSSRGRSLSTTTS
jgi:sulfide:quinone oxidoreductase